MGAETIRNLSAKPRVLVTGLSDGLGGTEVVVGRYVSALRDWAQFDFMATSELLTVGYAHEEGARVFVCPDIKHPVKRMRYLKRFFEENGPDYQAVWCNFNHLLYSDVLHAARSFGVPVRIGHAHNSEFLGSAPVRTLSHILRRRAKRDSTALLACSCEAGRFFWGGSFTTLPNALDFEAMAFSQEERERIRKEFSFSDDDIVICSVGRLTEQKNHEFLIRLLPDLRKVVPSARLLLVGDGVLRDKLIELSHALGMEDYVLFAGERRDVNGALSASDLFAFPSIFEGLGVAAVEAQVNGLPCICSTYVPDEACVSEKFVKLPLDSEEWIDRISSMSRPNNLAGGGALYEIESQKQMLFSILLGRQPAGQRRDTHV